MRIHLVMAVYVLFFASQLSLSRGEMACLVLAIGAVMAAEALNTAVEKLCDFAQKNQNRYIRFVKDVAAGAVLLSAVGALLAGVFFYWVWGKEDCLAQVNLARRHPLGPWFYPLAKYVYCGVTVAVLILGAVNGGIG